MSALENLQLFLKNYLSTKKISWLELFIFEYHQHKTKSKELLSCIRGNDKFVALSYNMSYHLLKLLFSAICDLMTSNDTGDNKAVLSLRHFLTNGLGSRIITMMSSEDLDLSNVTNERELVNVLTKIFPSERWDTDLETASLDAVSREEIKKIYKTLLLLDPTKKTEKEPEQKKETVIVLLKPDQDDDGCCEDYFTAEFNKRNETMQLSTSQLAQKVIAILKKLVTIEDTSDLRQTDQNSVTMSCLQFSLDTLNQLHEQSIFNDNDQHVIKLNLLELTYLCFNNLVNRDGKSIEPVFKKLFHLLELSDENELSCGLIINILAILNNLCVKKSKQKSENLCLFALCNHLILKRMTILSRDEDLLHSIQVLLIRIIRNVRTAHRQRFCDKKRRRAKMRHDSTTHHDSFSDACTFERLLIESFPLITTYRIMKRVLKYFCAKGICCCNSNIQTLEIFMRPTTVPSLFLSFIQDKVLLPIFNKDKICIFCNEKLKSESFHDDYFGLLRNEIKRRQGWELHTLMHHLTSLHRSFSADFLSRFILKLVVPIFEEEKAKFLSDPDENMESKLIVTCSLNLMNESMKQESIIREFFDFKMLNHIKDCSLIPSMATSACQLLKHANDNIKILAEDEDQRESVSKLINNILFSNVLFLTRELMEIYGRIDLPKDVPIVTDADISDKALNISSDDSTDFEILDEKTVEVKEALTDLDILLLNTIHWNIVCDLIAKDTAFQHEFVANIFNNFNGNILFTIAYNALNSILLKKELKSFQLRVISPEPRMLSVEAPAIFERCDRLSSVLISSYDESYERVVDRFYALHERNKSFYDKLRENRDCSLIYRLRRDNSTKFLALVHRDAFLTDKVNDCRTRTEQIAGEHFYSYHNWLNHIWIGIFEGKAIRDRFIKIVNRLVRQEEELKAIHRTNLIREITGRCGVKYLSSIARNCFDICWRLSDNISFTAKMSTALEELKLLLLQDSWDENKEAMVDTLQLLLGVAEMKTKSVSRMNLMDPENHLSSSTESLFSEYFSSLECVTIEDESDNDASSENNPSKALYNADESYDADEEYFSTQADTECSQSFKTASIPIIHAYRNTNEHICKVVVEVLMELSQRCVEKPDRWQPEVLISLAQRLSCMKTYLGGSEFILKGFSTILKSKNTNLIALQKTILELVEDLNSPDALKAFLSILTVNDAVVELIVTRLETLCNNELTPRPFIEVNYPTFSSEAAVISTCDSHLHRLILSFREIHANNKLLTPFTESSQIVPLNYMDFKPWNNQGFTVAAWINLPAISDNKISSHVISLGSEKLLMAIYVNSDGSFGVNVSKPNHNMTKTAKVHPTINASNKENIKPTNIFGIALATLKAGAEHPNIRTRGFPKNGTKKVEDESARRLVTSKVSVVTKRLKLKSDRWTHVCFSARSSESEIMLLITMNGTDQELVEIPIEGMCEPDVNGLLQLLCIGSQKELKDEPSALKYSISTLFLFRSALESPSQTSHLFSLGPDCDSLVDCEAIQMNSLLGLVDFSKIRKPIANIGSGDLTSRLKSNVITIYSAANTRATIGFNNADHGKPMEMFIVGKTPAAFTVSTLSHSVQLCGGLSCLLFLFARTIELTDDPITQSTALYVLLRISHNNNHLYTEFEQKRLFNLIAHVFKHSNCYKGPGMLKAILDVIYGGTMFNRRSASDSYQINEHSELNIQNPKLLLTLLENFSIFQSPEVLDLFFKSLMVVVRENHPHKSLNRQCLTDFDFYTKLIEFCKLHLASSSNVIPISSSTALVIVEMLKMLSKDLPVMWRLDELQKLLLLIHHPSESFITHDRSKFCFILPGNKPQKSSKLSLNSGKSSKYFNFSIKIRSTSSNATSPKTSSSPPRTPRTPNDSVSINQDLSTSTKSHRSSITSPPQRKIKARKLDELTENQAESLAKALNNIKNRKDFKTPTKTHVRRLSHAPKKSPFKKLKDEKKMKRRHDSQMTPEDEEMLETFKILMSAGSVSSIVSEIDVNRYETGVSVLQENLFLMIRDSVMLLDDAKAEHELPECLKMEMLVLFANHHDGNVRAAIVDLIHEITKRQSKEITERQEKSNIWVHLANQLSISKVNMKMAQSCVGWICGEKVSLPELSRAQKIQINYRPAFGVLIAMLPSMIHEAHVITSTTKFFKMILESHSDCITSAMLSSLIISSIKALAKMKRHQEKAKDALLSLLEQISVKALTGSIQTLWELLYGLAFSEKQKKHEVVREVHVTILRQLISLCLTEQSRRGSRAGDIAHPIMVVVQTLGTLPASEIKTRFHLIHDRALLFLSSWDPEDDLLASEIEFVKFLINLNFSGMHQGSNLLLWSLSPAGSDEIKSFIVQKLSSALAYDKKFVIPGSDTKLVKSLLLEYLNANVNLLSEEVFAELTKFCGVSTQQHQNWNWSMSAVEKIESNRQSSLKDQNSTIDKIVYKSEPTVQICIDSAMKMTRLVIDIQNKERRLLMNQLKQSQEIDFYREWHELIQRMIHEDAPWYNADLCPSTWELDDTEGPGRMRLRLKRSTLKIKEKFFVDEFKQKASYQHRTPLLNFLLHPKETEKYSIKGQVVFTFNGKHLTMETEIEGEVIITENLLIFLANVDTYTNSIICDIENIKEIWDRRYQHKEVALEVFLSSQRTFFIIFESNYERDIVKKFISDKIDSRRSEDFAQRWIDGRLSNYEYLIELNKIAGRTYNDLMQYPVFPWIISDYESDVLNLKSPDVFRKLAKTISTQYEEMEEHYVTNYKYLAQSMAEQPTIMKPYHYSSHYSNSGTILHFLVRLPPFTNMFLIYQDHNFDIPDRTFHSMATTFRLTSKESATDVKELIPEFFYLPDFFENSEGFNFGKRQSGELVNDVKLPPWSNGSSRIFTLVHRQALECDYVRSHLNLWIDLIFGFKQKGTAAVNAINVFHPATYPEFQITNITDLVERSAYETMIRTYGQMPKQIFTSQHKKSNVSSSSSSESRPVLQSVKGLRWGAYTGSPQLSKPRKIDSLRCSSRISHLVVVKDSNMFYGLPDKCHLMQASKHDSHDLILWGESDGVVRVKSLKVANEPTRKLFHVPSSDPVTSCGSHVKHPNLWFGHESGNISVYVRTDERSVIKRKEKNPRPLNDALEAIIGIKEVNAASNSDIDSTTVHSKWSFPIVLVKHRGQVVDLKVCVEFKIVVSIGVDSRTVIWDTQKIEYIRTIEPSCNTLKSQLTLVKVSPTLGDILTVFSPRTGTDVECDEESFEVSENGSGDDFINISMAIAGKSQLRLHSINAKYIKHTLADGFATSVCFSSIKEGTGVNIIAVGFDDGYIRLYSTWTLEMIREIATDIRCEISEIIFTSNHHLTFLADQEIQVWESDGLIGDPPKFNSIVLY